MGDLHYTLDQLMELAGQAVAHAVYHTYPPSTHPKITVFCGPGNNGGDGWVAARELLENAVDWCEEELTREEFMARMSSPSVSVDPDGAVEFAYDDGDMFAGHVIMVYLDPDGTFSDANIAG